jgi:alpha-1,2-mannosyltransferase
MTATTNDGSRSTLRLAGTGPVRACLWILGALSVAGTLARVVYIAVTEREVDLGVYLMGAHQVFSGHLYTTYLAVPREPFTYPPLAALLFIPLGVLSPTGSQVLWAVISVGVLIAFLAVSLRAVRPDWPRADVLRWALVLTFPAAVLNPIAMTFSFGQINLLLALLVVADLTGTYSVAGRALPRGIMTGVAAAIKVTPLIFVLYLFLTRQIRAGCTALAVFVACGIGMTVVAPSESWSYWTRYLFDAHRVGGVVFISNQSLRSAIVRFSHAHAPEGLIVVAVVVAGAAGLGVATWAYRTSSVVLGLLVCAVTGLVVSPITWAHHLVWIVPVVLWLSLADDRPAFGRWWSALALVWFWYGAIWRIPHGNGVELHDSTAQLLVGNSYTIAMVLFVVGVAAMLTRRHGLPLRGSRSPGGVVSPSPHRPATPAPAVPDGRLPPRR